MGQLLVMLFVLPIAGVVTYVVIRFIRERDENGASEVVRRRDPSAATPQDVDAEAPQCAPALNSVPSSPIA